MNKIIFLFLLFSNLLFSQKELWGVNDDTFVPLFGTIYYGNITKYDINGQNPVKMHEFNIIDGKSPSCKLFQASNGKIYGTTYQGGILGGGGDAQLYGSGILFEYDLVLNKYQVIHYFDWNQGYAQPLSGVIEPIPGKLYGTFFSKAYYYDFNLAQFNLCTGYVGEPSIILGELVKASNGFLYGTTRGNLPCPPTSPGYFVGEIFKINTSNNTLQKVYNFNCNLFVDGAQPKGELIEVLTGKLYGVAYGGGSSNNGTIFEYNINTNTFIKKIDFDGDNIGANPFPLVNGGNGKLYGVCRNGGTNIFTNTNNGITYTTHNGTLFEYTPATNVINKLFDFGPTNSNGTFADSGSNPISLMKTSNGYYMGTGEQNPFKFDPINNTVVNTINGSIPFNTNRLLNFIEICRKPSYQEFLVNTFSPAVGAAFTFNVNNTNAATYIWKKGSTVLPTQTTGILNIPSVSLSDTGVYTCTMTNECGTTITANLNINVTNLSVETIDDYKTLISLYPNPTKGIINLKFPENRGMKGINYKITNLLGQVILENDISKSNKTELAIDTSGFANGVYQLMLITDKGNWNGKFVKD